MATDSEALVLSISADVAQVKRALDRLTGDAKKSAKGIEDAFSTIGRADPVGRMQQNLSRSVRAMNQDAKVLSFQLTDIAQGLSSGQSPFVIMNQQIGQVMQALSGAGGLSGALGILKSAFAISLPTLALLGAVEAVKLFFSSAEDGSKKAQKAMEDSFNSLQAFIKEYEDFLSLPTKKVLIEISRTKELEQQGREAQKVADDLVRDAEGNLDKLLSGIRQRLSTLDMTTPLARSLQAAEGATKSLIAAIASGQDPMENIRRFLAEIAKLDMAEPEKNWKAIGDMIKNSILPTVKEYKRAVDAGNESVKKARQFTEEERKSHEDAKKAVEEMRKIGVESMTELQRLWEQYSIAIKDATGDVELHQQALDALSAGQLRLQEQAAGALGTSIATSSMSDVIKKIMQVESGGKNIANIAGTSSAFGLFQFTAGTFVDAVRMIPEFANATRESILAQRANIDLQIRAMEAFTKDNAAYLSAHGKEVNDATLYLAHFLGKAGAVALLNAPPGTPARQAVGRAAVAANPFLAGMTREDIIAWAARKMGGAQAQVTVQDIKEQNDALRTQAEIQGEISAGIDLRVQKEQTALKLDELIRAKKKEIADEHRDLTKEEIAAIEKEAAAYGKLQGQIAATKQAKATAEDIQGVLQRAAAIEAENRALGNLGTVIDEVTYKRIYAVTVQQLMQKASEDGTVATQQETVAIQNAAAALARAEAAKKGWADSTKAAADSAKNLQTQIQSMAVGAITGLVQDLRNGTSAAEAFYNAISRIADQLLSMALNMAIQQLFKSLMGGPFGIPIPGLASGGYTGDAPRNRPAGVVHGQEFVVNAKATQRHRGLLEAINSGLPGYAGGGFVVPNFSSMMRNQVQQIPQPASPNVDARTTVVNTFDAGSFLSEALSRPDGVNVILNAVRAQPGAFRQAMQG